MNYKKSVILLYSIFCLAVGYADVSLSSSEKDDSMKINVGDVFTVGNSIRILVYDMIDSYYFINDKGYVVTDSFQSLDEAYQYTIQNHENNKTEDYADRVYKKVGNLVGLLTNPQKDHSTGDLIDMMVSSISKYGSDKKAHMCANIGIVTMGDNDSMYDETFGGILIDGIIKAMSVSMSKEYTDKGVTGNHNNQLTNIRDMMHKIHQDSLFHQLDKGDLYADIIGICVGAINSCMRELEFIKDHN